MFCHTYFTKNVGVINHTKHFIDHYMHCDASQYCTIYVSIIKSSDSVKTSLQLWYINIVTRLIRVLAIQIIIAKSLPFSMWADESVLYKLKIYNSLKSNE